MKCTIENCDRTAVVEFFPDNVHRPDYLGASVCFAHLEHGLSHVVGDPKPTGWMVHQIVDADAFAAAAQQPVGVTIDIVFDGPPGHEAGRFVEVEDADGKSIRIGEWINRGNGMWALRLKEIAP